MRYTVKYLALIAVLGVTVTQASDKPNIIFMLSDNLGYGDLGSYGGGIIRGAPTPRLDQLAAAGTRYTNFNVEAECTPSRSALMTGRYAVRSGTTRAIPVPGIPQGLAPWEVTLAEILKDAGYATGMMGKWHIGASPGRLPTDQGFDYWWGFPNSTDVARFSESLGFDAKLMPRFYLYEGTSTDGAKPVEEYTKARRPYIDATIEEKAIGYIEKHARGKQPFFLFVSWSLVHHPSLPHPDFAGKSGSGRYADVMLEHDYRVGRILDKLDEAGIADDTLVVYASDNGPDRSEFPHIGDTGPFRGFLGSVHEGSIRTPLLVRWPGKAPAERVNNGIISIHDFLPTLATIAGAKVPGDRAIDGVDQSNLLLGRTDQSARDSVLFFHDDTLLAVKWKQFKLYLAREGVEREDTNYHEIWAPEIFNLEQDPKESHNIAHDAYLWMLSPVLQQLLPLYQSVKQYGLVQPGDEGPSPGEIRIPIMKNALIEKSLSNIKQLRGDQ